MSTYVSLKMLIQITMPINLFPWNYIQNWESVTHKPPPPPPIQLHYQVYKNFAYCTQNLCQTLTTTADTTTSTCKFLHWPPPHRHHVPYLLQSDCSVHSLIICRFSPKEGYLSIAVVDSESENVFESHLLQTLHLLSQWCHSVECH